MRGDGSSDRRLLADGRGRIPFAVVAVLLLVSAVVLVGYLETRGSPDADTDVSLAIDRTDAAVQTALRDATASAAHRAAEEPLTAPANTSYGDALDPDRPFVSYLEGLVYLAAADRFETTGQRVGAVETSVSLPAVSDAERFGEALDRVEVTETEPGLLRVEVDGVRVDAHREGERVASETRAVTVSVPTPVLQQHERTETFQSRLDTGITSPDIGFTHRFNARIYALGWLRGYAQYSGLSVTEVIANRHVEPSANSALYRTQQDVFGTADPRLADGVRRGWFCMAAQDAEGLYGGYTGGSPEIADDICTASEWVFGERHTAELPEFDTLDVLANTPGINGEHTIGVNETAYSPLRTLVAGDEKHSIEQAIERAFTIETAIDAGIDVLDTPEFDHERPHPDAVTVETDRSHRRVTVTDGAVEPGDPTTDGTYYRFADVETALEVDETVTWKWTENGSTETVTTTTTDSIDLLVTVRLAENETAPSLHVDSVTGDLGVEHRYEFGPGSPAEDQTVPAPGFRNYADRQTQIAEHVVGGPGLSAFGSWLGTQWANVTSIEGLGLPATQKIVLDIGGRQERKLVRTALGDVQTLQQEVEGITHTFERADLVHGADEVGPVGELTAKVADERNGYLDRETDYENVGQQAVYEVRYAYFEQLLEDLSRLESAHSEVMSELDSQLDDVDSSLDHARSFLRSGVSAERPDPVPIESPPLTPEITYEVSGSPTYLAGEVITTEEVPAVTQGAEFSPFAARTTNYLKLPYQQIVSSIVGHLLEFLGLGDPEVELTLRTAGEALRAGELAGDAADADEGYGDGKRLDTLARDLELAVESALHGTEGFTSQFGVELVAELYGVDPDYPSVGRPPFADNETYSLAYEVTRAATTDAVADYDSTAEAAIAIGGGTATEPLIAGVGDALDGENLTRPSYARHLTGQEWQAVVASAVRPALDRAAANATGTLDGTDTIERLDTETRRALANVSADIVDERLVAHVENSTFDLSEYEDWVGDRDQIDTPVRVPAGLPLLPLPSHWVATMNLWDIDADGQYARFELVANMSAPGRATSTTYVRENTTVTLDVGGEERTLGRVEPIGFDGRSLLVVVVPPGGIGVGDRDDENPECTETYPVVGPVDGTETACG
jgi:hypothetical protein